MMNIYIKKLELINVQKHSHLVINLRNGVNIFWGKTGCGKSAIIRALRWILANDFSSDEIRKDGTKRIVETSTSLITDSTGKPIGFRGLVRDLTERRQAQKALQESEEKYRMVVENSLQGLIVIQDGRLIYANQAICDIIGYTVKDLLSCSFNELLTLIHPEDQTP